MNRYKCPKCGGNQYSASPDKAKEPCIYCGHVGTVLMNDLIDGKEDQEDSTETRQDINCKANRTANGYRREEV